MGSVKRSKKHSRSRRAGAALALPATVSVPDMRGVTSLEQFLDEQTEKRSDIALLLEQNGVVLPPARTSALAAPSAQAPAEAPTEQHLCWNGLRVSPEFERYAARVAQGEDLPPFRGPVLASASAFPWSLGESHTATTRLSEPPAVQV